MGLLRAKSIVNQQRQLQWGIVAWPPSLLASPRDTQGLPHQGHGGAPRPGHAHRLLGVRASSRGAREG